MKIGRKLFLTTALATLLGLGAFAGAASLKSEKEVKLAEAAGGDATGKAYTFYCNWGAGTSSWTTKYVGYCTSTSGDDWTWVQMTQVSGELWSADIEETNVKRLIFRHTQNYYKGCSTDPLWTSDVNGIQNRFDITSRNENADPGFYGEWKWETSYGYTVNYNANGGSGTMSSHTRWIYSDSGGSTIKTNTFTRTNYVFDSWNTKSDGSGRKIDNGATLNYGDALCMVKNGSVTLYAQWVPAYTVTFMDYDKTTTLETKNNVAQGSSVSASSTPTRPDSGSKQYTFSKWVDVNGNDMTSSLANVQSNLTVYASYTESYKAARYMTGVFGSCNWGVEGAAIMTKFNENEYRVSITLEFGDTVKCAYYNGSSFKQDSFFGYSATVETCGAYFCFTNDLDDNLVCYAGGTYLFYFTDIDNGYGTGKRVSVEIDGSARTAEQLAAKLMSYGEAKPLEPGDNTCGTKFPDCKSMYLNNLSADEKTTFRGYVSSENTQFKNAYDRYVAWAAALGEKPWESGKVNAAIKLTESISSSNVVTIVIAISTVCFAAFGGYFLFKKKHQ